MAIREPRTAPASLGTPTPLDMGIRSQGLRPNPAGKGAFPKAGGSSSGRFGAGSEVPRATLALLKLSWSGGCDPGALFPPFGTTLSQPGESSESTQIRRSNGMRP